MERLEGDAGRTWLHVKPGSEEGGGEGWRK